MSDRCNGRAPYKLGTMRCKLPKGHEGPHSGRIADPVSAPPHYTFSKIEPIDAIEAWGLGFCLGNCVKYIARSGHKGSELQDLLKSKWYLERTIKNLEGK